METDLLGERLRITEQLLVAVADPARLHEALDAMMSLMDADLGMLASERSSSGVVSGLVQVRRAGSPDVGDEPAIPMFPIYRRRAAGQPASRLHRLADIPTRASDELAGPACMFDQCMAHLDTGADRVCYIGFARTDDAAPFEPERIAALESVLPHVRTVYALNRQFESFKAVSSAVMNRYERYFVGVVMVDQDGFVLYHNRTAQELFEQADGLAIDAGGRIVAQDDTESSQLRSAVREHIDGELLDSHFAPGLLKITRSGSGSALSLAISPYRGGADHVGPQRSGGSAVIMIYNPDRPPVERVPVVSQMFNLTAQESELACALAAGKALEDIAREEQRSLEAVRSQLKRIFRKTGTSRQTELVKLVLSGPAAMVQ